VRIDVVVLGFAAMNRRDVEGISQDGRNALVLTAIGARQ
jgi:hypothetical protein